MKTRKLIKGMMAVAIVAVAGLAIYANQPKEEMTDVMLANIEALATTEYGAGTCFGTGPGGTNVTCYGGSKICCWGQGNVYGKK